MTDRKQLKFDLPIILTGPADMDLDVLRSLLQQQMPLIAADGGANVLVENGIMPSAIIGDFDSVDKSYLIDDRVELIKLAEQDSSDFEKCLYSIDAPLFLAFGFVGKRFDHTLASLNTLMKYYLHKKVILISGEDISFVVNGAFSCAGQKLQNISLFPLMPIAFNNSLGLQYPLDGLELKFGGQIGTSNRMNGDLVRILPIDAHLERPYLITLPISRLEEMRAQFM